MSGEQLHPETRGPMSMEKLAELTRKAGQITEQYEIDPEAAREVSASLLEQHIAELNRIHNLPPETDDIGREG